MARLSSLLVAFLMAATAYPVNAVPLEARQAGSSDPPSDKSPSNSTTTTATVTVTVTAPGPIATLAAKDDSPSHVVDLNKTANSTAVDGKKKHIHPIHMGQKGVFGKNATASAGVAGSANGTDVSARQVQEDAAKKAKGGKKGEGKKGKKGKKAQKGSKAAAREEEDLVEPNSSQLVERFVDVIEARDHVAELLARYNDELEAREPEADKRDGELVAAKKGGKKGKKGNKKGKKGKGKNGKKAAARAADASDIDPYTESAVVARQDADKGNDLAAAKKGGEKGKKGNKKGKKGKKGDKAAARAADASDIDPYTESPVAARQDAGEGNNLAAAKKGKKGGQKSGTGAAA